MSDSDSSCEIVRLSSNPYPAPKEWDVSPESMEFELKIRRSNGKLCKFVYTLKEGVPLPYAPDMPGLPGLIIT